MESKFGHDFSRVRVHDDAKAARSARAIGARAYTLGHHIVFANGRNSTSPLARRTLAHELTHVRQQDAVAGPPPSRLEVAGDGGAEEREARAAEEVLDKPEGERAGVESLRDQLLQRQGLGEWIARLVGEGTFSEKELLDYLELLDDKDWIEGSFDSDNKARAVVERWARGDSAFVLPVRRKILLIEEMLEGPTLNADEEAILRLLRGSTDRELASILSAVGEARLRSDFHGDQFVRLERLLAARRGKAAKARREPESAEVFPGETILKLQERFRSNSADVNRLNCILIIRDQAPRLFAADPDLAKRVSGALGGLKGGKLKMTEVGRVMSDLGLVSGTREIKFNPDNGSREPTSMEGSAWDAIIGMVGGVQGWHVFGMAIFDGFHSVTVLVDNRPDGPRVYWADQWRIDPGDDFHEAPGSVSGFRRYEKGGFDRFIAEKTKEWWKEKADEGKRWKASLHIWKFRSRLEGGAAD